MARIALDRCLQAIEAEASEIPTEWRQWRVEIELARGNWDAANSTAKYVPGSLFAISFLFTLAALQRCPAVTVKLARCAYAPWSRALPLWATPSGIATRSICASV